MTASLKSLRRRAQQRRNELLFRDIDLVKEDIEEIRDFPLKTLMLAEIARITGDEEDRRKVHNAIRRLESPFRSRTLVLMIRDAARRGNYAQAREITHALEADGSHWRANAFAAIFSFSCMEEDLAQARVFAEMISDPRHRKEAQDHLDHLEERRSVAGHRSQQQQEEALRVLLKAVAGMSNDAGAKRFCRLVSFVAKSIS